MLDNNWLLSRILIAIAGAFGAFTVAVFWLPKEIREKSALIRGIIIGGVGVSIPLMFTGWILRLFGMDGSNLDNLLAMSGIEGGLSLAVLMWLTNFFKNRENKDLIEVVSEVRGKTENNHEPS